MAKRIGRTRMTNRIFGIGEGFLISIKAMNSLLLMLKLQDYTISSSVVALILRTTTAGITTATVEINRSATFNCFYS